MTMPRGSNPHKHAPSVFRERPVSALLSLRVLLYRLSPTTPQLSRLEADPILISLAARNLLTFGLDDPYCLHIIVRTMGRVPRRGEIYALRPRSYDPIERHIETASNITSAD